MMDGLDRTRLLGCSELRSAMNSRPAKLFIIITVCAAVAYGRPAGAETLKKEPDANELSCGQKGLVENNTCPADQILQITGSCLNTRQHRNKHAFFQPQVIARMYAIGGCSELR
ncbi:MAG: DUF6719 family protein, partial [Pseudolabrys sp.]